MPPIRGICSIRECGRPHYGRTYCLRHWQRWRKYGNPTGRSESRIVGDRDARFWSKVVRHGPTECWPWVGTISGGYGVFRLGNRFAGNTGAHRFAYEMLRGPIPKGLHIDHLCQNKRCVNPAHLEPVTLAENVRRRWRGGPMVAA